MTQGQEAKDDADALALFARYFVETGLVNESFRGLIERGRASLADEPSHDFEADVGEVSALVEAVQNLYDNMDESLRFRPPAPPSASRQETPGAESMKIDREADFRGVTCPLNYVKTKLLVEQMSKGQVLSVLLDKEGGHNVPESARQDGHDVLLVKQEGNYWRVLIRKTQTALIP